MCDGDNDCGDNSDENPQNCQNLGQQFILALCSVSSPSRRHCFSLMFLLRLAVALRVEPGISNREVAGSTPALATPHNNLRQVVHSAYASVTEKYNLVRRIRSDALRLRRQLLAWQKVMNMFIRKNAETEIMEEKIKTDGQICTQHDNTTTLH